VNNSRYAVEFITAYDMITCLCTRTIYVDDNWGSDFVADIGPSKGKKDSHKSKGQEDVEEEEDRDGDSFSMPVTQANNTL